MKDKHQGTRTVINVILLMLIFLAIFTYLPMAYK